MGLKNIRVLIVDDSQLFCDFMAKRLNAEPDICVVAIGHNGKESIELTRKYKPDVITMDVLMPEMGGVEAVGELMAATPTPILMVSSLTRKGATITFEAIAAGALDFIKKDQKDMDRFIQEVIAKIRIISPINVVTHVKYLPSLKKHETKLISSPKIVAIAVSTGGPSALPVVLEKMPADIPAGIIVVQHMAEGFTEEYAKWLNNRCSITVLEGQDKQIVKSGVCYIAPANYQTTLTGSGRLKVNKDPLYMGYRPSANLMFESVAKAYKKNTVGVIMTGMGNDGAKGIADIKETGGKTIAQDGETSVIYGMNQVAVQEGSIQSIVPLPEIASEIIKMLFSL